MPKVRLLVPMVGEKSWNIGDEFECSAAEARRLFKGNMAERMPESDAPKSDAPEADAPEADGDEPADYAQAG